MKKFFATVKMPQAASVEHRSQSLTSLKALEGLEMKPTYEEHVPAYGSEALLETGYPYVDLEYNGSTFQQGCIYPGSLELLSKEPLQLVHRILAVFIHPQLPQGIPWGVHDELAPRIFIIPSGHANGMVPFRLVVPMTYLPDQRPPTSYVSHLWLCMCHVDMVLGGWLND